MAVNCLNLKLLTSAILLPLPCLCSPLERSRISASPNGRVVQPRAGQPHRLCGVGGSSTLSLSRAFGDGCECRAPWGAARGLTRGMFLGLAIGQAKVTWGSPPLPLLTLCLRLIRCRGCASWPDCRARCGHCHTAATCPHICRCCRRRRSSPLPKQPLRQPHQQLRLQLQQQQQQQ
jgi:hypothetical protein